MRNIFVMLFMLFSVSMFASTTDDYFKVDTIQKGAYGKIIGKCNVFINNVHFINNNYQLWKLTKSDDGKHAELSTFYDGHWNTLETYSGTKINIIAISCGNDDRFNTITIHLKVDEKLCVSIATITDYELYNNERHCILIDYTTKELIDCKTY